MRLLTPKSRQANLVVNGGFEDYTTSPGVPDGWTRQGNANDDGSGGVIREKETSTVFEGESALRVEVDWDAGTAGSSHGTIQDISGLVAGKSYYARGRIRLVGAAVPSVVHTLRVVRNLTDGMDVVGSDNVAVVSDEWVEVSGTFVAVAGKTYRTQCSMFKTAAAAAVSTCIWDKISIREIQATDSSGNGNHGTLKGGTNTAGPTIGADGQVGTAYEFDGVDDYMEVPDDDSLDITDAITISAWVNATALDHAGGGDLPRIVDKGTAAYGLRVTDGGAIRMQLGGVSSPNVDTASGAITPGSWFHVVGTYDGANVRIYVNGVLAVTVAVTGAIATTGLALVIGASPNLANRYWHGRIDQPLVIDRALIAAEVAWLYNGGEGRWPVEVLRQFGDSVVGYWPLDEPNNLLLPKRSLE